MINSSMAKFYTLSFSYVCFVSSIFIASLCRLCDADYQERQVHIVYMGSLPKGEYSPSSHHFSILREVVDDSFLRQSLVRSYNRSFNGFAAYLTDQEREKIASYDGVVSVFPSRTLQPQTTRSWDFMGFSEHVRRNPTIESNVIIGVIDTGIWPESQSFNDQNIGPVPTKWKGVCAGGENFTCSKKIIGARYYTKLLNDSARDIEGHGTHTASTAAGSHVKGASFYGLAQGTARGGVPSARIAAYKVCVPFQACFDENILAAFDDAIADGVDLITISIGSDSLVDVSESSIAIGAFHALEKGILTVNSAGNNGLEPASISSVAPWLFTVAASTIDRRIIDKVVLGNGRTLVGNAVNSFNLNGSSFPLVYGRGVSRNCLENNTKQCDSGCVDSDLVKGKIVLCRSQYGPLLAQEAGALGSIASTDLEIYDYSEVVSFPSSILSAQDFDLVEAYIESTRTPRAKILKSEAKHDSEAPVVVSFSSKGPNVIIPEILKPDITAPGVDILAAYSPASRPSDNDIDTRSVEYNLLSGTSMACPHVAGAAAYIKTLHPDWSPSAIKSALMTTAWPMNASKNSEAEFAYGAGHIDPGKGAHPGLVFETSKEDYIKMLCSIYTDESKLRIIFGADKVSCLKEKKYSITDFNYPSMAKNVDQNKPFVVEFSRKVKNVGLANSTYKASISKNSRLVDIIVLPRILSFKSRHEEKSFVVIARGKGLGRMTTESASLVWSDGIHSVRSPIVIYTY